MAVLVVLTGCSSGAGTPARTAADPVASPDPTAPAGGVLVRLGDAVVTAEVADQAEERTSGLMHRELLAADAGMLFLMPAATTGPFWMKNTLIPLSIGFLRATGPGRFELAEVRDMEPCPSGEACPTYYAQAPFDAALEVNQGWFESNGVRVGAEAVVEEPARPRE